MTFTGNRLQELPANWRTLRQRILTRDDGQCTWVVHGQRCTARATQVDHIHDRHNHTDSNLRSLCGPHEHQRTSIQGNTARWTRQTERRPVEPHPGLN